MKIGIGHIEVFVDDIGKAKNFYVNILKFKIESENSNVLWAKSNCSVLLFRLGLNSKTSKKYTEPSAAFVLYTDNLSSAIEYLEKKGVKIEGYDGSYTCPTFRDPFGNWIQLVDPTEQ